MLTHVDNRITYSGNGNATEFAYQFKILDRTDIKVLLTDADGKEKLLTKDYYVDVEKNVVRYPGYAVGAEVPESERPPVLPAGWKLTIYREVPVTQETDLPDQYPFNQVEAIGDKLTMIAQQLTDVTSRSLKISVSTSADIDTTIPWENGKSFRISDDGKTLELSEDPAKVLPLAQGVYAQTQAQAQSAAASATAAAKSEDSAFESAGVAGNSAQYASLSAASAAENAELTSGYKQEALTAKADATASATNAKASEANAKISENNAEASKEAAQSAATSASNFATDARNSAGEAKTYKDNAKTYRDNAKTYMDNAKNYSENVNVFTPSVSTSGVLSWTNKAGLANPPSVNIKGEKGDQGLQGIQGVQGVKGDTGAKGDRGATGAAATIRIGTVTTGASGSEAVVTNVGTANDAVFNFTLPRGEKGADGGIDIDTALSDTSTNPVQNKVIKSALDGYVKQRTATNLISYDNEFNFVNKRAAGTHNHKIFINYRFSDGATDANEDIQEFQFCTGRNSGALANIRAAQFIGTATSATQDGDGRVIADKYVRKGTTTNLISNNNEFNFVTKEAAAYNNNDGVIYLNWRFSDETMGSTDSSYIKQYYFLRGMGKSSLAELVASTFVGLATKARADEAGNIIADTYAKSSAANIWKEQQDFKEVKLGYEKYLSRKISTTSSSPTLSLMQYEATGAFTLNLSRFSTGLQISESTVFTAYITSSADYPLTITNAGTIKYIGSASDVAITSAGLLLNILMMKDADGVVTSIVQASKLEGGA